jgi:hypothetical protein
VLAVPGSRVEQALEIGHVGFDEALRGGRRPVAPELLHQPVGRDRLVPVQEQDEEERALFGGRQGDDADPASVNLEGPEGTKFEMRAVRGRPALLRTV